MRRRNSVASAVSRRIAFRCTLTPAYDVVYDHLNQIYDRAYNRYCGHCHQFHDQMNLE